MPYKRVIKKRLGELLLERGVIDKEQLSQALSRHSETGRLLGETLVEMGLAQEADIAGAIAAQYGIPYLPLKQHDVNSELLKIFPEEFALKFRCFPVDKIGSVLTIAIENPLDDSVRDEIARVTGCRVLCYVSTMSEIMAAIREYYGRKEGESPDRVQEPDVDEEKIKVFQLGDDGSPGSEL